MKISELKNCPHWLKEAITKDADVTIVDGIVHWHSGTWNSGVWYGGIWENGDWYDGHWLDGIWENGGWFNGNWYGGTWHNGTWRTGIWHNGTWHSGTWQFGHWHSGAWNTEALQTIRFKYLPKLDSDKSISIGCKTKTREEWDAWFAGDEVFTTPRGTDTFKLIVANYKAFIAYAEELNLFER